MEPICCIPKFLPSHRHDEAAETAVLHNPANRPAIAAGISTLLSPAHLALMTTKYWGAAGVVLTVGFLERTTSSLANRILTHMNRWGNTANVKFVLSSQAPQVRISRGPGGYWSYIGTDLLHVPPNQQTMNLEGFTDATPDSEFERVVQHETGHVLGFPHEHMRAGLVRRLDAGKTIAYFRQTQAWSEAEVRAQVLTPLDERTLLGTPEDQDSIMCYQLPGSITVDGQPIRGGVRINPSDAAFAAKIYPPTVPVQPPSPPAPPTAPAEAILSIPAGLAAGKYRLVAI